MFTPESFGLMQPNGHSSPMNLRLGAQASTIQFPPILFPQLSETTVATAQGEELEVSRKCKQNFFDIIQTVMGGRSSQSGEDVVDARIPAFCPPISRVVKGGLAAAENRPSLELVGDSQTALESSGSTPPSTLDSKKVSPTSLSSPSWPSGASEIIKSGEHNPSLGPDEPEERSNSGQMEIFTDSIQPDTDGIYFCHLCEYTGKKRQEFQSHLRSHYDYHCPKCDYTSRTEGRLRRHMEGFHSAVPPDNFSGKSSKPANKLRLQRCKQCDYVADTKTEYWQHQRVHIKADRQLHCTQCPFVTEYRHHLEYHIRNHLGSKPYKCSKCNYECVNKSMLNSHMKSHTNVYQYRCADCNYATKYCHSLKMHLAKYKHTQTVVLNVDGSLPERANALAVRPDRETQPASEVLPFPLPPLPALLPPLPPAFPSEVATENSQENLALMTALVLSVHQQAFPQLLPPPPPPPHQDSFPLLRGFAFPPKAEAPIVAEDDVLDLSAPKSAGRRDADAPRTPSSVRYECPYCEIIFKNETLFEMHKQFHDPKSPFLCKRCGTRCRDSVEFFNHINEKEHVGGL